MTIELNVAVIIQIASGISIVAGAILVLVKFGRWMLKPLKDLTERVDNAEKFLDNDKKHLEKIDYIMDYLLESNQLLLKNTNTMMRHMEDGNHTGEIKQRIKETEDFTLEGISKWKIGL